MAVEPYRVSEVLSPVPGVRVLRLKPERGSALAFKPGQYVDVHLFDPAGAGVDHRQYSIASSPSNRAFLEIAFRLSGPFTAGLFALKVGDAVGVEGPFGAFVFEEGEPLCVFIAGGVGVTPLVSMVRFACEKTPGARLVVLYSSKTKDIVYQAELEELAARNPNVRVVFTVPDYPEGWAGEKRFIDKAFIREFVPDVSRACVFVCGPPPMIEAVGKALRALGVPENKIKFERF